MNKIYQSEIEQLKISNNYRELSIQKGIDFCSNDYLGLSKSKKISEELILFLSEIKSLGSTGSRLISGHSEIIQQIELEIAEIFQFEACTLFGSGYLANIGIIQALSNEQTCFFSDELNHASIIDGLRLSRSNKIIFKHNDYNDLENKLSKSKHQIKIIILEAIYSMDGDSPNLKQIAILCAKYSCILIIDESHSIGILGQQGKGLASDYRQLFQQLITINPCGKAIGAYGAFINSSNLIKQLIINKSRSFIYSTAVSSPMIAHIIIALREMLNSENQRLLLAENISYFKSKLDNIYLGKHVGFISMLNNEHAILIANQLKKQGIAVKAIRSPTVQKGKERIRICLQSTHSRQELDKLTQQIKNVQKVEPQGILE